MEVWQLSGVSEVQMFGALGGGKPGQTGGKYTAE
jgi:hypothetical protein